MAAQVNAIGQGVVAVVPPTCLLCGAEPEYYIEHYGTLEQHMMICHPPENIYRGTGKKKSAPAKSQTKLNNAATNAANSMPNKINKEQDKKKSKEAKKKNKNKI